MFDGKITIWKILVKYVRESMSREKKNDMEEERHENVKVKAKEIVQENAKEAKIITSLDDLENDSINSVLAKILEFRDQRDWKQFHTPENLAKSIAIESGEILEHFQWGDALDLEGLKDEIADVLIYSFLLADAIGADIETIMLDKLSRNQKRFPVDAVKGNSGKRTRVD